jgi:hypothetical protein
LGYFFARADTRIARAKELIDRLRSSGKDVSGVQAALDALGAAIRTARPSYQAGQGIIASHPGFDDGGNVIDPVEARQTVQKMRTKLVEVRAIIRPAVVALRQQVREFRQSKQPLPGPTPGA